MPGKGGEFLYEILSPSCRTCPALDGEVKKIVYESNGGATATELTPKNKEVFA